MIASSIDVGNDLSVTYYDRDRTVWAAQHILDRGGWCVYEICTDVCSQQWEPRVLVCHRDAVTVADAVEAEIALDPAVDARITGCNRRTLQVEADMGAHVCYLAPAVLPPEADGLPVGSTHLERGRSDA